MKIARKYFLVGATIFCFLFLLVLLIPNFHPLPPGVEGNDCINNLLQIEAAKHEWALENGKTNGDIVTVTDIMPYIKTNSGGYPLKCPQGGTYIIGRVGENPICTLHGDLIKSNSLSSVAE